MTRRKLMLMLAAMAAPAAAMLRPSAAYAAAPVQATLWHEPQCSCCEAYAQYLEQNGFQVEAKPTNDLAEISAKAGVPEALKGCHTMFVAGYVVDGLVPVDIVRKLLVDKPAIAGITLPGMPSGAPGMPGERTGTLTVYAVSKDGSPARVFAVG